jgi:hypothetical protein
VIASPSSYWNVTGWRDPLAVLEANMLRKTVFTHDWLGTAYITMGSGLKGDPDVGGRVLLYHTVVCHLSCIFVAFALKGRRRTPAWSTSHSGSSSGPSSRQRQTRAGMLTPDGVATSAKTSR